MTAASRPLSLNLSSNPADSMPTPAAMRFSYCWEKKTGPSVPNSAVPDRHAGAGFPERSRLLLHRRSRSNPHRALRIRHRCHELLSSSSLFSVRIHIWSSAQSPLASRLAVSTLARLLRLRRRRHRGELGSADEGSLSRNPPPPPLPTRLERRPSITSPTHAATSLRINPTPSLSNPKATWKEKILLHLP